MSGGKIGDGRVATEVPGDDLALHAGADAKDLHPLPRLVASVMARGAVNDMAGSVMGRSAPPGRPRPALLRPILSKATAKAHLACNEYRRIRAQPTRLSCNLGRS